MRCLRFILVEDFDLGNYLYDVVAADDDNKIMCRMIVAPDQPIILGWQIFLDHRSLGFNRSKYLDDTGPPKIFAIYAFFCG